MSLAEVIRPRHPEIRANTPVILSVHAIPDHPGRCVAIISDEFWHTREHGRNYPYCVVEMDGERELSYAGTDSLLDARALAWHLSEPMPTFTEDAPFEPSEADRLWWAAGGNNDESELDAWLDSLAPDYYQDMEGGDR